MRANGALIDIIFADKPKKVNKDIFRMTKEEKFRLSLEASYQRCLKLDVFKSLKKIR